MKKSKLLNIYKIIALAFVLMLLLLPKAVLRTPEIEAKLLITTLGCDREGEKIVASGKSVILSAVTIVIAFVVGGVYTVPGLLYAEKGEKILEVNFIQRIGTIF